MEPRAVDWDLVTEGVTEEEQANNSKYAISIARKFGCVVFCVWEDFVKVSMIC
jgi:plastin-1